MQHLHPFLAFALFLLLIAGIPACDAAAPDPETAPAAAPAQESPPAAPHRAVQEKRGSPLPAFDGVSLEGKTLSLSELIGKRFLLAGFNPEVPEAKTLVEALSKVASARQSHNFEIVGVAAGSDIATSKKFLDQYGLALETFDDRGARLNNQLRPRFGMRSAVWLLLVDADGNVINGLTHIPLNMPGLDQQLRDMLRIESPDSVQELLSDKALAPLFTAQRMQDKTFVELSAFRGKPVLVMFFLHTCEHCHKALRTLRPILEAIPEDARPTLLGISIVNQPTSVMSILQRDGLDFFTVLSDASGDIQKAYGATRGVPVIFGIDGDGRIQWRVDGWKDDTDPPLMRMRLHALAGQPVPMLLRKNGYSGNEICSVCHASQATTWSLTNHATAYNTLVKHGADHDAECVRCHVVGYGQNSGFSIAKPKAELENVGCESCHGAGGPHRSPDFVVQHNYESVCLTCHNKTHSVGFEYATFLPQISHSANLSLTTLPPEELAKILETRQAVRDVLPKQADYVGSPACLSCHPQEHETWSNSPHANALTTLEEAGEAQNGDCLRCHTTGYGEASGFPTGGASDHPGLAGVGCESCHGPGGDHVMEEAPKRGTILSLGDKCDSCVILQICGSCHDDANDPGFEFEVQDKIDRQRHGTIEAGTGQPLQIGSLDTSTVVALLDHAFTHKTYEKQP